MTFLLIFLGVVFLGLVLVESIKMVLAILGLALCFLGFLIELFILFPLKIIRNIQENPPVSPTKNE